MNIIEVVEEMSKGGFEIEYDNIIMETKLFERSEILSFDEKWFFSNILGFTP